MVLILLFGHRQSRAVPPSFERRRPKAVGNSWGSGGAVSSPAGVGRSPKNVFEARVIFSCQ